MPRPVTEAEITRAAKTAGIPENVLRAMLFRGERSGANSTSPKGAYGQAQIMPGTAKALEQRYRGLNTRTAYGNVLGGAYYLAEQKQRFGSWRLAFAAYNAGPGAVAQYHGIPPYKETQDYVRRTMAALTGGSGTVPPRVKAGGGGVAVSSSQTASAPQQPAAPDPLQTSSLEGLQHLIQGDYSPTAALHELGELRRLQDMGGPVKTPSPAVAPQAPMSDARPGGRGGTRTPGITYAGQKLTHDTDGLPGYPAVDLFGKPGTPFTAPESGRVVRLSGRGGTKGGYYGWSIYFQGDSGRKYYIQHLNKARAKRGRYKEGTALGTISPWEGGAPHAHVGIKEK